jgi:hypothetical protein
MYGTEAWHRLLEIYGTVNILPEVFGFSPTIENSPGASQRKSNSKAQIESQPLISLI